MKKQPHTQYGHNPVMEELRHGRDNPATTINKLKEPPGRIRWARPIEIEELLKHANPRLRKIILFAVSTGLRTEEIKRLKRSDIIIESQTDDLCSDVNFISLDFTKGGILTSAI